MQELVQSWYANPCRRLVNKLMPELVQESQNALAQTWYWQECSLCGACCVAPDISSLEKPLGQPCQHLGQDCLCQNYQARPSVCHNYTPDWVCGEVAPLLSLEARVARYLEIYGLEIAKK